MRAVMASRTVPAPMITSGLSAYFRGLAADDRNDAYFFNFIDNIKFIHCSELIFHTLQAGAPHGRPYAFNRLVLRIHERFKLLSRRQAFVITGDLDGHGPDGGTPAGSVFQVQSVEDGAGEADGKAVTGTDGVDDVVDVITRHAVFLAVGRADIRPMAAAHLDDNGLDAAQQVVPGNIRPSLRPGMTMSAYWAASLMTRAMISWDFQSMGRRFGSKEMCTPLLWARIISV